MLRIVQSISDLFSVPAPCPLLNGARFDRPRVESSILHCLRRVQFLGALLALLIALASSMVDAQTPLERLEAQVIKDLAQSKPLPNLSEADQTEPDTESGYFGIIGDNCPNGAMGVQIIEVVPGGPAERAGLAPGDIITGLAGQSIQSAKEFTAIAIQLRAGTDVEVHSTRSGQPTRTLIRLDRRPPLQGSQQPEIGQQPEPPNVQDTIDPRATADITALHRRIEELEQRIRRLERLVLELSKTPPHDADLSP